MFVRTAQLAVADVKLATASYFYNGIYENHFYNLTIENAVILNIKLWISI
ncbi:hypothetical protein SAMN04488522_10440 [Pedobacter caeni]|uniref:Uncharacterized protein n=1 Tax=Pedobacter caeni TaxID=288992 RepID=A0A1M5G3K5_9SPHI|nr:hypothetical protein SAMN04488522_10440 [Pedobacter caeni]